MSGSSRTVARYGGLGVALLRALAEQGSATFTIAEARERARTVGIADSYLTLLLHRLERSGWVHRVKRGAYALTAGLPGFPEADPTGVGMALIDPSAVSGWWALNFHRLTEQVPLIITLTTPKRIVTPAMRGAVHAAPSVWDVAGQRYEIISVVPGHFFGFEEVWMGESRVRIFDRERALLDCFALPHRFGGVVEGLAIVEEHLRELDVGRLVKHAQQYGTIAVAKRVGYALESAGAKSKLVEPLRGLRMQGYRPLDPTRTPRGARNRRWGLVENGAAPHKRAWGRSADPSRQRGKPDPPRGSPGPLPLPLAIPESKSAGPPPSRVWPLDTPRSSHPA